MADNNATATLALTTLKRALSTLELPATRREAIGLFLRHLALGEILLDRLDAGLERHGTGLHRLRRLLRAQEAAHHDFGVAEIAALAAAMPAGMTALRMRIPPYRLRAQAMIEAATPVLHVFGLSSADIGHELDGRLAAGCMA